MKPTYTICVFFAFYVRVRAATDFRPTPIPLKQWYPDLREGRTGTLHETIRTSSPPTAAEVPVRYWEGALRHSVYLTLVRDKIDHLIAKGDVLTPDGKKDRYVSKEIDDHDLWEKIKNAPFDRMQSEDPFSFGDVTIMAKGRLLEENESFRFTEDETPRDKCDDVRCMEGVMALWSVKRVRQRDVETSPGKYHYELTFSVITQNPKKHKNPYESPMRTFTVRETPAPERILDVPQEYQYHEPIQKQASRPERAIWFHKNIVPTQRYQARHYQHGLERIFTSLFSDDEPYEPPQRYKPYSPPILPPYSKAGYVGSSSEQYYQKRQMPYSHKHNSYKYSRPPLPPPPLAHFQHHYPDIDGIGVVSKSYVTQATDHKYIAPNKTIKTSRPIVLPTPSTPLLTQRNFTVEVTTKKTTNGTDDTTTSPETVSFYNNHNKPKPIPMKVNYFPDHIRPPIYNTPPGVFVTMDKKPFKPMPPVRLHTAKPTKTNKPTDFRPSPQVLDVTQFSEPDPLFDIAFRPITINYANNPTEKIEGISTNKKGNKPRKSNVNRKKSHKKQKVEINLQNVTTAHPDIIIVQNDSEEVDDAMQWANVLGAFTKTTPMVSQKDKAKDTESTSTTTSATISPTSTKANTIPTEEVTSPKPRKRTRPPPQFTKSEKAKKHTRVLSTTTKAPEKMTDNTKVYDLTPEASSAATREPHENHLVPSVKPISTTALTTKSTSSSILSSSTTPQPPTPTTETTSSTQSTSTTQPTSTTVESKPIVTSPQQGSKNRFRQSTLMHKGTSVKHDRWSSGSEKTRTILPPTGNFPPRRKGSKFQGHNKFSTSRNYNRSYDEDNKERLASSRLSTTSTTTETSTSKLPQTSSYSTEPTYDETIDQYDSVDESESVNSPKLEEYIDNVEVNEGNEKQESRDNIEYVSHPTTTTLSDTTKKIIEIEEPTTELTIVTSPHSISKNKTKCKKKNKHHILTNELEKDKESQEITTWITSTTTSTESAVTPDIFEELLGGFTSDDSPEDTKLSQSTSRPELQEDETTNHERYVEIDDKIEDILALLNKKERYANEKDNEDEYDDETDKEIAIEENESSYESEDYKETSRGTNDDHYDDYSERPFNLLELMAME